MAGRDGKHHHQEKGRNAGALENHRPVLEAQERQTSWTACRNTGHS